MTLTEDYEMQVEAILDGRRIVWNHFTRVYDDAGGERSYEETFHAPDARILVVDDTKMNLVVVEGLLMKTGIMIDTATNGPDSVKLAEENAYDVILMDQRMPGMDGTETMKAIRDLPAGKNRNTPMICLTADVIRGAKDRYLKMGFDDYITKPVDGARLEKVLIGYIPAEKIEKIVSASTEERAEYDADGTDAALIYALEEAGVNTGIGLGRCQNDVKMYKNILGTFASEEKEKSQSLRKSFEAEDTKEYGIFIHSVKSTAATIGAMRLSELAAKLERAAKDGNTAAIREGHVQVMEMYAALAELIRSRMDTDGPEHTGDDDILEFLPE